MSIKVLDSVLTSFVNLPNQRLGVLSPLPLFGVLAPAPHHFVDSGVTPSRSYQSPAQQQRQLS